MNLLKVGEGKSTTVYNLDNLTRCFLAGGKDNLHLYFVGSEHAVELAGKDAVTAWSCILNYAKESLE